jgi:hypothetical protein
MGAPELPAKKKTETKKKQNDGKNIVVVLVKLSRTKSTQLNNDLSSYIWYDCLRDESFNVIDGRINQCN